MNLAKTFVGPFVDVVIIFTLSILIYLVYKFRNDKNRRSSYVNQFSGPKTLPILGNGLDLIFEPTEFYNWSWGLCKKWGDPIRLWKLNVPMIFVSTYENAIQLLSKPNFVAKSLGVDMFWRIPGGNGLSSTPAYIHPSRKKILTPGFSRQIVERSVYIFSEESQKLVKKLEPYANSGEVFEAVEILMPCSFRIICRSAFGDDLMMEQNDSQALEQMHALHTISLNFTGRLMSPYLWKRNDFIYFNLTKEGRYTKKQLGTILSFGTNAINRRRTELAQSQSKNDFQDSKKDVNHNRKHSAAPCFLNMLLELEAKGDLKESDILGELNNYIVAGYDTSALAVAWTLFALALNPLHQDKILDEINEIFNSKTFSNQLLVSAADTKKMKYLELCVKESLRLFPASPVLPRSTTDDMILNDGRVIPGGIDVLIMVDMIHRDPKHFPNPDEFLPERFLQPNPAFLPFSTGARNCIGQVYAMHQIKVELAYLIREYIWETTDNPQTIRKLFQALLVPADGIHFKIKKRKLDTLNN